MERILYVVSGAMVLGGTETMIMNYYRYFDKSKIQIDFVCYGSCEGAYDKEIESLGGRIYRLPAKRENLWRNLLGLYEICKNGHYKVIHVHMDAMSFYPLLIAKFAGIRHRICHCHSTKHLYNNAVHYYLKEILKRCIPFVATELFACSKAAGDWLYKERCYQVVPNAIDLDKFRFAPESVQIIREKFGFGKAKIVGHVGNFNYPKNQEYLIRIFESYHKNNPDTLLVLVGEGPDRKKLENLAIRLNIDAFVRFLGQRKDISELLQCFDVFVMTSFFEGLPVVAIEAQAAGVPCLLSDAITRECVITPLVKFCSLDEPIECWEEAIDAQMHRKKENQDQNIKDSGYEIKTASKELETNYLAMMRR